MAYASIVLPAIADGTTYCLNRVLPAAEGDLSDIPAPVGDPIGMSYQAAAVAAVEFGITGNAPAGTAYVVLQTDLGDGVWYDLAWCVWTPLAGGANFLLAAGVGGANAFQQTRAAGSAPASNGSNQAPLGGRIRFVGKLVPPSSGSSSSSSPGPAVSSQVTVTIRVKLLGLR